MKSLTESLGSYGSDVNIDTFLQNHPQSGHAAQPIQQQPHLGMWEPNQMTTGVQLKNCNQLYGWQKQIVDTISNDHDIFVVTESPGGGKTLPIIAYWAEKLLGINVTLNPSANLDDTIKNLQKIVDSPETLPQVIWFSPIRSLNDQTVRDEFVMNFITLILQYINFVIYSEKGPYNLNNSLRMLSRRLHETVILKMIDHNNGALADRMNFLFNSINSLRDQINLFDEKLNYTGQQNADQYSNEIENLTNEYFSNVEKVVKIFVETQLVGVKYQGTDTSENKPKNTLKPIIVTVYESSPAFIDKMNRLKMIVFDEIQKAQLSAGNIASHDERAHQIAEAINYVLSSGPAKNARLICLTGTQNPHTAARTAKFYNIAYGRDIKIFISEARNPANIRIQSFDQLSDFHYVKYDLIPKLLSVREKEVCFVFFSKYKINEIAEKFSGGSVGHDIRPPTKTNVGYNKSYYNKQDVDIVAGQLRVSDIKNPLVRNAAGSRIGVLYGPERNSAGQIVNDNDSKDNAIIQYLFEKGEIYILLTTDYIGEGLNVNIKKMYIPSVEKSNKEQIPIGNLAQLLNRVGRRPMDCVIYTPSNFVDTVMKALNAKGTDFDDVEPAMSTMGKLKYGVKGFIKGVDDKVNILTQYLVREGIV